jgi:cell division septum initiation protein DivIVA
MSSYEFDDEGGGISAVHDSEAILRRVIDIIATARTIPLSASPMINRDEIIELLEESLHRFPDDLRQARWMLKERDEFLAKTQREADDILESARAQAERMVQRTEVVRASEQRARQVIDSAEAESRRMKHETEDFVDQRLASFQIVLEKVHKAVMQGREKLNGPMTGQLQAVAPAEARREAESSSAFFDQDLG